MPAPAQPANPTAPTRGHGFASHRDDSPPPGRGTPPEIGTPEIGTPPGALGVRGADDLGLGAAVRRGADVPAAESRAGTRAAEAAAERGAGQAAAERDAGTPALEAVEVGKVWADGTVALSRLSLAVREGETMVLVGESGSGKTTLLRMFNRLIEPTTGEIRVAGTPVSGLDPIALRRRIGYVPQDGGLLPHWRIERNVGLVPALLGWEPARRAARTREMLELVGLDPRRYFKRYPAELSGGQRQRVAFARALAADPPVVLLDEPFGALDAITRLDLQGQFLDLKRRLKKTTVLVTHDLGEAFRLGDRIGVMRSGALLQLGRPQELVDAPADEYVRQLLALRAG